MGIVRKKTDAMCYQGNAEPFTILCVVSLPPPPFRRPLSPELLPSLPAQKRVTSGCLHLPSLLLPSCTGPGPGSRLPKRGSACPETVMTSCSEWPICTPSLKKGDQPYDLILRPHVSLLSRCPMIEPLVYRLSGAETLFPPPCQTVAGLTTPQRAAVLRCR